MSQMTIERANSLPKDLFTEKFKTCCGSSKWVDYLYKARPFKDFDDLLKKSDEIWNDETKITNEDYLEAFRHHPKIGDVENLRKKFASTAKWSENEQKSVQEASEQILRELKEYNELYEKKFGFIFIVCATGKSASEMLEILKSRLPNDAEKEFKIAAEEQNKITNIRLHKLFDLQK